MAGAAWGESADRELVMAGLARAAQAGCLAGASLLLGACSPSPLAEPRAEQESVTLSFPACPVDDQRFACQPLARATSLQYAFGGALPLRLSQTLATHNSYNSQAYPLLVSGGIAQLDPNQQLSISEQLALGIRGFELDLHTAFHASSGARVPVLCHTICSATDRRLRDTLEEFVAFLQDPANDASLLLLDIGDGDKGDEAEHNAMLAEIESALGPWLIRPPADEQCHGLPLERSLDALRQQGQVLLSGSCGLGAAWPRSVFANTGRVQKANDAFDGPPNCESDSFSPEDYVQAYVRLWEDSTFVAQPRNLQAVDATVVTQMRDCGVNMISLDQLIDNDDRLMAFVWAFEPGEPQQLEDSGCALHAPSGAMRRADCSQPAAYACLTSDAKWQLLGPDGPWRDGQQACATVQARFVPPQNASRNQQLKDSKAAAGVDQVWVGAAEVAPGRWRVLR